MPTAALRLRTATANDVPLLNELIPRSVRALSLDVYTERQIESAITHVFGVDSQLVADGTYFVVEDADGALAGCGGWSFRHTLYGGDQIKTGDDPILDPARDAARVRAFFVSPEFARRGVGSLLMQACFDAAYGAGFRRLELMATLPGVPLYERWGFAKSETVWVTLPDGVLVPFVPMTCDLATVAIKICVVEDRFVVTYRRRLFFLLFVAMQGGWNAKWRVRAGDTIEVRTPNGARRQAQVKRWEWMGRGGPEHQETRDRYWLLSGVTKADVNRGDEIRTVPLPNPLLTTSSK